MTNRRDVLFGGASLLGAAMPASALTQRSGGPTTPVGNRNRYAYDYLLVEVKQGNGGTPRQAAFLAHLTSAGAAAIAAAGGELIGYFTPLIGWSSEQLAVMVRWPDAAPDRERAIAAVVNHTSVAKVERNRLAATTRPAPTARPEAGGIYTHRWFNIRNGDLEEFVQLSDGAWPDFEREFEARIFGLFRADPQLAGVPGGVTRMLLNTWYRSHAVWDASRTPSAGPAGRFDRRGQLTLTTRVVSLRFTPVPPVRS